MTNPDADMVALSWFLLTCGAAGYMLPTIIAVCRRHPNTLAIAAINVAFGWSLIGLLYAATLAATPIQRQYPAYVPPRPAGRRRRTAPRLEPTL